MRSKPMCRFGVCHFKRMANKSNQNHRLVRQTIWPHPIHALISPNISMPFTCQHWPTRWARTSPVPERVRLRAPRSAPPSLPSLC